VDQTCQVHEKRCCLCCDCAGLLSSGSILLCRERSRFPRSGWQCVRQGLRQCRELLPMLKSQLDLENRLVHISDSKTDNGIGDMPMTEPAYAAFKQQIDQTPGFDYLFPRLTERGSKPYLCSLKKVWRTTLRRAGLPHFSLYELRHTFATRLSSGGVADHFVTLMLRQGDAEVFKRYSQAKLNMMREALDRLDRRANEHERSFGTARLN
jgi:integrase